MLNNEPFFMYQAPFWKAEYHDPPLSSYRENPLIEALPPVYNRDQAYKLLQYKPSHDEFSRQWPSRLRLRWFVEAARFFQPLNIHFELEQRFSRLIRAGYVGPVISVSGPTRNETFTLYDNREKWRRTLS